METELHRDVKLLHELVNDLDVSAREQTEGTLDADLIALAMLEEARRNLAIICTDLTNRLAQSMPKQVVVEGVGVFERRKKKSRTQWEKDALLSAVLDSRMFDRHTGELIDETPLEKVLATFNLPAPRVTVLRERGIDADQFCTSEDAGWQIQVVTP